MGQLTFTGELTAGPGLVTSDDQFPSGESTIPFSVKPTAKPYTVDTGKNVAAVPVAYAPLSGIGPDQTVKNATFLYLRSESPVLVRVTQTGGSAEVFNVTGLLVIEPASGAEITLVEVQGGGRVEYYACGAT